MKFIANCVVPVNSIKQVCKYENWYCKNDR
jgi:hypothetical protein